ncbi:MAG: NifB/NifX family molybdenum-iron cluster-binding protein [Sedimentisphaerales bacterium]|nr:NifB/NifX family molybdenum-iron cluster-binding protein [Sedimentisphaerales bacterium]
MKVAIPVWQDTISSVFDFADKLSLTEIEGQTEKNRLEIPLPNEPIPQKAGRLKELDVDVLICGAISKPLAFLIIGAGIKIIPFVSGRIDEVLNAYMSGRLTESRFLMPGCRRGARKGFARGGRRCRWRGGL